MLVYHEHHPLWHQHSCRLTRYIDDHQSLNVVHYTCGPNTPNVAQLWREAKGLGYPHSVQRFSANLQPLLQSRKVPEIPPPPLTQFIAKKVVWSFIRDPKKLTLQEHDRLNDLCESDGTLMTLYTCVQDFIGIVHARSGEVLDPWIEQAKASSIRELQRFVAGLERDKVAVQAGLTVFTAGQAERGKTSVGWFYGFKLHLVINDQGEILAFALTPGNVDDRQPVPKLARRLMGKLIGDKG